MNAIIKGVDICRQFPSGNKKIQVLNNVNVDFEEKTLTVLKGRSGSGKTTLMNILGTLDRPTSGRVFAFGEDITDLSEGKLDEIRKNNVSFVFQSVALMGTMSAYENVEFMLRIAKKPMDKERILHCLDLVGLSNRVYHMPYQLSGGEQQRVAIARAIVHRPKVIFADEPTAQLDSETSKVIMNMFHRIIEEEGVTVIMTTHDQNMMELADKVYTLDDGKIVSYVDNREGR
ncbi:MAG: ABC transporter ATP-binding protein [Clostridia bacterium]|nr:ABC transporter ATP-binding protein [Clostridia bacterium]